MVTQLAPDAVEMMYLHFSSPLNVAPKMILPVSIVIKVLSYRITKLSLMENSIFT